MAMMLPLGLVETPAGGAPRLLAAVYVALATYVILLFGANVLYYGQPLTSPDHVVQDFDAIYTAGTLALSGNVDRAYAIAPFMAAQRAIFGQGSNLPWSYPPQFDLVAAALALMPRGIAYAVFVGGGLAAFFALLWRIAGQHALGIAVLVYMPVLVVLLGGQNGFLTASLVGIACVGLLGGRRWAGVPLGLLVIKPHLAIGLAVYVLASRRWGTAVVAAGTVALTALAATLLLGPGVWVAFLGGIKTSSAELAESHFLLFRMVSPYAAVRSFGASAAVSLAVQVGSALLATVAIVWAALCLPPRAALGVAILATLLFSPYLYDYDMVLAAFGLALLLPDLVRLGRPFERSSVYLLVFAASGFGYVQFVLRSPLQSLSAGVADTRVTLAGVCLLAALLLIVRIVARMTPR